VLLTSSLCGFDNRLLCFAVIRYLPIRQKMETTEQHRKWNTAHSTIKNYDAIAIMKQINEITVTKGATMLLEK